MLEENEVESTEEVETTAVEDLINQIGVGELNKAQGSFQSIVQDKMNDALNAQKVQVAGQIFNELEDDVADISDEEVEEFFADADMSEEDFDTEADELESQQEEESADEDIEPTDEV
tara:strand:+ start:168 stop:518 length:351 start_codon:yes stop_codon:yes gene_type:complete